MNLTKKIGIGIFLLSMFSCSQKEKSVAYISAEEQNYIVETATSYIDSLPVTVTAAQCLRSEGGLHDFYSEGDYWWPDPENPDDSYIRKDGQTNPENFVAHRLAMIRLSRIVGMETSAYLLTGDDKFARAVEGHLNAWFVQPETKMNPSLNFAQAIKGRVSGRGIGIIDAIHLIEVARSVEILEANQAISAKTIDGTKKWFSVFIDWLTSSEYGKDEMNTKNNHATCWVMQVAAFARLTDNSAVLDFCRNRFKDILLPRQMAADGSFPLELARTKPYGYSLFNLDAFFTTAEILSDETHNLYAFTTNDGKNLEQSAEFMFPYVKDKSLWPYEPDVMYWEEWPVRQPFLLFAGKAYEHPEYIQRWKTLDGYPETQEVIRNLPIRNPLLWLLDKPVE